MKRSLLFLALLATISCKRLSTGAREEFAKKYSCPEARVTVIARSDLHYGDLVVQASTEEAPEEVKKDPERLAKFTSLHSVDAERTRVRPRSRRTRPRRRPS